MKFAPAILPVLMLGMALVGCNPSGTASDEEKEPHYLEGKSRENAMDVKGALESFEKALEVNPHSAAAHLEAGLLYEKQTDYAASIYHLQRYLELRPRADLTELVKSRILACKQELAKSVSLAPVTQSLQNEFERLTQKNKELSEQLEQCRASHGQASVSASNPAPVMASQSTRASAQPSPQQFAGSVATPVSNPAPGRSAAAAPAILRTHTVKAGETPSAIARKYGIKLDALMAANPRLDPRRLQVGQSLAIPAP